MGIMTLGCPAVLLVGSDHAEAEKRGCKIKMTALGVALGQGTVSVNCA